MYDTRMSEPETVRGVRSGDSAGDRAATDRAATDGATTDRTTGERPPEEWPPEEVQRLRARLGLSQAQLAARIGTRQQTISEWETGARAPRRMSRRLLQLVAEESGRYEVRREGTA